MAKIGKRSCKFNDDQLKEEEFKPWLERSKDVKSAFWNLCMNLSFIQAIMILGRRNKKTQSSN